MKLNFWIFLFVGIIIVMFIYLRRKDKLELAKGIPDIPQVLPMNGNDIVMDKGIFLPGNGEKTGWLDPNGIYYPHIDDPIWLKKYYDLGNGLGEDFKLPSEPSPFVRRVIEMLGIKGF